MLLPVSADAACGSHGFTPADLGLTSPRKQLLQNGLHGRCSRIWLRGRRQVGRRRDSNIFHDRWHHPTPTPCGSPQHLRADAWPHGERFNLAHKSRQPRHSTISFSNCACCNNNCQSLPQPHNSDISTIQSAQASWDIMRFRSSVELRGATRSTADGVAQRTSPTETTCWYFAGGVCRQGIRLVVSPFSLCSNGTCAR